MTKPIIGVSFFSGGGFMDRGAEMAGIHTAWANEIDPKFAAYHAANFHHPDGTPVVSVKSIDDVTTDEIINVVEGKYGDRTIDIVCGGPPCVDLSRINSRKKTGNDSKTRFVLAFLDKIIALNPKVAVMEQVPQLLTDDFHFPLFLEAIKKMNYEVKWKVLSALSYESNSIRRRAIFIFVRKDLGKMPVFPKPIPEGRKMCGEFLDIDSFISDNFDDAMRYANEPMTTLTSGSPARFFKNGIARKPTERELMLCQSLDPDTYILPESHTYSTFRHVTGNSVPVRLAYHIFKTIVEGILTPSLETMAATGIPASITQ